MGQRSTRSRHRSRQSLVEHLGGWRSARLCPRVAEAHSRTPALLQMFTNGDLAVTSTGGRRGSRPPQRRPGSAPLLGNTRSDPTNQANGWPVCVCVCVSMHARDAGIHNSCGPRAETFGQCWQLEMKDRWSRAHLTECYVCVCVCGGGVSQSHIINIMQKSSTQALLDIL